MNYIDGWMFCLSEYLCLHDWINEWETKQSSNKYICSLHNERMAESYSFHYRTQSSES
jgi:hypothetical protein